MEIVHSVTVAVPQSLASGIDHPICATAATYTWCALTAARYPCSRVWMASVRSGFRSNHPSHSRRETLDTSIGRLDWVEGLISTNLINTQLDNNPQSDIKDYS